MTKQKLSSIQHPSSQQQRMEWMLKLMKIVRQTGEYILQISPSDIYDTIESGLHQFSTIDAYGSNKFRTIIAAEFDNFSGTILEESEIPSMQLTQKVITYPLIVGDAIEGSTNAKRGLAALLPRSIAAGTSAFILESEPLCSIAASAFFDFSSRRVFSSMRGEASSFLSFMDNTLINAADVKEKRGDSNIFVVVPGYSHQNISARAQVEEVLLNAGINTTGGSRSSAQDLLNILCNQVDGYVDLRALFPGNTPQSRDQHLHSWDIGGILPVLDGLGFCVTDPHNHGWQLNSFYNPLPLIVARPSIYTTILDAITSLPFISSDKKDSISSIPFHSPPKHIGN